MKKLSLRIGLATRRVSLAAVLISLMHGISAPASASSTVEVAQAIVPLSDGKTLPNCPPAGRIDLDCHLHEKASFLTMVSAPSAGFPHVSFEYEAWRRVYMAR